MADNFFAMLQDGSIRRISLVQGIEPDIRRVFVNLGQALINDKEEVEFDGNYTVEVDEILFVSMNLGEFGDVINNPINIPILNLSEEEIRALFWYEDNVFYFQNFDSRKLLQNKNVIVYSNQTYNKLTENAFIIDNSVTAVYKDEKFYFRSYANANKIFDLSDYYVEATNEDLQELGRHTNVSIVDLPWLLNNANSVIRKQVALIKKNCILDGVNTKKIRKGARGFNLDIELDRTGKIIFPRNKKGFRDILIYLNEQFYVGLITGTHYKTNSKKKA